MSLAELHAVEQRRLAANATEPDCDEAIGMCVRAWRDLSSCRSIGFGAGPIPWTAIVAWCDFHELDREAATVVIDVVQFLDIERAEREASERELAELTGKKTTKQRK